MRTAGMAAVLALLAGLASQVRAGDTVELGTASWFGPGGGAATHWCTWTLQHSTGCGTVIVTSIQTRISARVPVVTWCQCYIGTSQERIIDLQWGVVAELGLRISAGLYPVSVQRMATTGLLPNTSTKEQR